MCIDLLDLSQVKSFFTHSTQISFADKQIPVLQLTATCFGDDNEICQETSVVSTVLKGIWIVPKSTKRSHIPRLNLSRFKLVLIEIMNT
jgi:hypothetical protein